VKACLRNLMAFVLLLAPVSGIAAPAPSPNQNGIQAGDTSTPADQAQIAPPAEARETREADMQFPVTRTLGGIGLVLCIMVVVYFAAKKIAPRYFHRPASDRNLKIVETLSMGDRRSISLIEVASNRFLIGNTPQQINLLAALPEPVSLVSEPEAASVTPMNIKRQESRVPFRNLFEVEKSRPMQYAANPLPEDLRVKMRQLRNALERQ
jgi:flagellar biosynthetic protein FliO